MTAARRPAAGAARTAEPFVGNEGLTDDLADGEASAMLAWLNATAKKRLAGISEKTAVEKILSDLRTRARLLGKALAAHCYDDNAKAALAAWTPLGLPQRVEDLPADPAAGLKKLLEWEEARHA